MKPGMYKHFKGEVYEVLGEGIHTETEEPLIFYRNTLNLYARPKAQFLEMVKGVSRFEKISDGKPLLFWDVYEINSSNSLQGVMLRGRIRKFCIRNGKNVLVENTPDGIVRFAVLSSEDILEIETYLKTILSDVSITLVLTRIANPVLSKLKVNKEERYLL